MDKKSDFKVILNNCNLQNRDDISNKVYKEPRDNWISKNYSKNMYASYKPFQFVDGEGVRCSLYLSGCLFCCNECFNASIQNFGVGKVYDEEIERTIIKDISNDYVQGLTILGGEPFLNTEVSIKLCKKVRAVFGDTKDIWVYSGFTYEQLLNGSSDKKELLSFCDVLVDGPFIYYLKDLSLNFRGSSNQRVIDVKKSTLENVVLYLD